jgi:hypothetical protein
VAGHAPHYTLDEANAALPRVRELIGVLRSASERLGDREAREALSEASPGNGGGDPGRTVSEGFVAMREAMMELRERGIVLRDLQRGLVDFPALRDGQEVYLCWEEGEDEIGWWHEPEAGFGGRRPLDGD